MGVTDEPSALRQEWRHAISFRGSNLRNDLLKGLSRDAEVAAERVVERNDHDTIEAARHRLPGVSFEVAGISDWRDAFNVILASAVIHSIPRHDALLPRLIARLGPRGSLAVQTPDEIDEPSHRLMREIAAAGRWAGKLVSAALNGIFAF
jgi:trans-aconitate methyltransferase